MGQGEAGEGSRDLLAETWGHSGMVARQWRRTVTERSTEVSGRLVSRGLNVYFEMDCSACQGCGMSGPDQTCSGCGGSGVETYHLTRELPDDEADTRDKAIARLNAILREEHGKPVKST